MRRAGFTMLELMFAMVLFAILTVVCFFCFNTVVRTWESSTEYADRMQHADYALTQVISGLRSAYYPTTGTQNSKNKDEYGFALKDGGDGPEDSDTISWTKLGTAIVGESSHLAETPHTVRLWVEKGKGDEPGGLMVRAWRGELQTDDFDPDDDVQVKPYLLVDGVQGFNCRVLDKTTPYQDGKPNWQDTWDNSNCIPRAVELTFTLKPVEEGGEPLQVRRIVEIPLWDISQNPVSASSSSDSAAGAGVSTRGATGGGLLRTGGGTGRP